MLLQPGHLQPSVGESEARKYVRMYAQKSLLLHSVWSFVIRITYMYLSLHVHVHVHVCVHTMPVYNHYVIFGRTSKDIHLTHSRVATYIRTCKCIMDPLSFSLLSPQNSLVCTCRYSMYMHNQGPPHTSQNSHLLQYPSLWLLVPRLSRHCVLYTTCYDVSSVW